MKTIRDAVHQGIELSEAASALLDTPQMQRLRHVKQLGLAHLVYPSAGHNRLEHSLGTYYLTSQTAPRLVPDEQMQDLLGLSGLLHDVGHSAFSHLPEHLIKARTGKTHEQLGEQKILHSELSDVLSAHSVSPRALVELMHGPLFGLVSNEYGTDRVDYLLRDAHFTGVSYSLVDAQRLLSNVRFEGDRLVLSEKGVLSAESLLVSRYLMFRAVYHHHANRIASAMLIDALGQSLDAGTISVSDVTEGRDDELLYQLRTHPLVERIRLRRLFKTAFLSESLPAKAVAELTSRLQAELPAHSFVVCPADEPLGGYDVPVRRIDGSESTLFGLSPLAQSLSKQLKAKELIVAAAPELVGKAKSVSQSVL